MTLAETQALFHEAITSPGPVALERLERCFVGSPALPVDERVAIYSGMYTARLVDALRATFPQLGRLLGCERFTALSEDYIQRHPSTHHDVGQLGRLLPAFLREHPAPDRPDLADLAELSWARQEVFFEAASAPVGAAAFTGLTPEAFAGTGLRLSPALRLLELEHPVDRLWRSLEAGQPPDPPSPGPAAIAVWRSGFEVFHRSLPLDEAAALAAARRGDPLAELCAAFALRDEPEGAAHAAISGWLGGGWITGVA